MCCGLLCEPGSLSRIASTEHADGGISDLRSADLAVASPVRMWQSWERSTGHKLAVVQQRHQTSRQLEDGSTQGVLLSLRSSRCFVESMSGH